MSGQQGSNASYWPRRMSSTPPRDSYCLLTASSLYLCLNPFTTFPFWGGVYCLVPGTPLPLSPAKSRQQTT
jgi:hypothetical protein